MMMRIVISLASTLALALAQLDGFPEATMLHMASQAGDMDKVKDAIASDPEMVHARTVANITALHLALQHTEVVAHLLKSGAQCDLVDINNETPLMAAAKHGLLGTVDTLLAHKPGPDLTKRRNDGYTALMLAVLEGQPDVIPSLLKADPNPNANGPDGYSAVTMAAAHAVKDKDGQTLRALLSTNIPKGRLDLNQPIDGGRTAIMIVSNNNQPELVKLLIDAGASASGFDADGQTPLMHAINGACGECVKLIIETDSGAASINERDKSGWTALMLASRTFNGDEMVPRLLSGGADTNAQKKDGISALMLAAGQNRSYTISNLLDAGADPTLVDKDAYTALHIAASRGFKVPCKLLLEGGSSQTAKNSDQETAFGLAVDNGFSGAARVMREYNGEVSTNVSSVIEVDREALKQMMQKGEKPILAQFYAPWCEHCKKFAFTWEQVGMTLAVEGHATVVKADAASDSNMAGKFGVEAFPTIMWFPKGSNEGEKWKGARMYDAVMHFVNEKLGK